MADLSQYSDDELRAIAGGGASSRLPDAIGQFESGGNYRSVGPLITSGAYAGDRAYGKYQVMGKNIPDWSQEILGRRVTPMEFLASNELQDQIAKGKLGQFEKKYGPEGAARAWFAGEGGMNDLSRQDQLGTSVGRYGRNVMALMGQQPTTPSGPKIYGQNELIPIDAQAPPAKGLSAYSDDELLAIAKQEPTFKERFGGFDIPASAKTLEPALRSAADEKLMQQMEQKFGPTQLGRRPTPSDIANAEFINTAGLNAPRNLKAYIRAQSEGIPFDRAYEQLKSEDITSRALRAGEAAGTYAGIAEAFDSKDPLQASIAAGMGAGLGTVAAPVAEKIVGLTSGMVRKGFDMAKMLNADGSLTSEAALAARGAGVDPEDMRKVFAQTLTERLNVQKRGQAPTAAPTPAESGEVIGQGARAQAAEAQAGYRGKYEEMRRLPGQFEDIFFTCVGDRIKINLFPTTQPIVLQ